MPFEPASRTVTLIRYHAYPEGEGPPEARFDRSDKNYMLLVDDQPPPPALVCEKLATFDLDGPAEVQHSRLMLESVGPIAELVGLEMIDGFRPHKYVASASPVSLFGILNIAGSQAGAAMGIGTVRRFDPPVPIP